MIPAQDVLLHGDSFEMIWVDALAITTEVVENQPIRDGASDSLVVPPVRVDLLRSIEEAAIPFAVCPASPDHAAIFEPYLRLESFESTI